MASDASGLDEVERLEAAIVAVAEEFVAAVGPALRAALKQRVDALLAREPAVVERLDEGRRAEVGPVIEEAIERGVAQVEATLRKPDLWFEPTVFRSEPGSLIERHPESVLDDPPESAPDYAVDPSPDLDYGYNRAWIAITNGADALDPVLMSLGFVPSPRPDVGGGHFDLQPQTSRELDPSGRLIEIWERYVALFDRYGRAYRRARQAPS